jgi:hypothetical protein
MTIHNPKNIHDTMGWKLNFEFLNQKISNPCQTTHKSCSCMNVKKQNQISWKKLKLKKKWKSFRRLLLHWFFTHNSTTKTFFVTNLQMLMHYPNIMAFTWKNKCWTPTFKLGIHHIWIFSCFNSNNDLKAQNLLDMKFEI